MKRTTFVLLMTVVVLSGCSYPPHARGGKAAPSKADVVVATDGSGKYKSVQEAIVTAPQTATATNPWVIFVKAGIYKELVYVQRERGGIRLVGEDAEKTVITYGLNAKLTGLDGREIGTFRTPTAVIDGDDFVAENLTFENSAGAVGQALAVRVDGDRVVFRNCRFLGWQDTVFINRGRQYFTNCYIAGHVDFIFGGATAWFEDCHIHALKDGYLTAASTPVDQRYGYVFSNCKITGEPGVQTYLGRPWRSHAATVYLRTAMSDVVRPEGWNNWKDPAREKTTRYAEYKSSGAGAKPDDRAKWAKRLTDAEAARYTVQKVLAGHDGWNPAAPGN